MGIVSYSPDSEPSGGNWETVTDSEIIKLLDSMAEQIDGAPDGRYTYYSDNYLKREAEKRTEADEQRDREAFDDMNEAVKDEAGKTGQEGEHNAFLELAPKAVDEHIKFESNSIVPGFLSFVSDVDVHLGLYKFTLHAGVYFLQSGEEVTEARIYTLTFDADELLHVGDGLPYEETTDEKTGVTTRAYKAPEGEESAPISFSAKMEPIPTRDGEYLTYLEYVAWLAMAVAPDPETRDAIFNSAYHVTHEETVERDEDLPRQDTARPRKRQDPKTKISRLIGIPEKNAELYKEMGAPLTVAGKLDRKRGVDVEQVVAIEYMGADGIVAEGREQLTQLDRQVHNAIISHFVAGNRNISLVQICELVYGHNKPTDEQKREVEECIERQMWTRISIDMSEEIQKHKLKHPELLNAEGGMAGQMLAIRKLWVRAPNGRKIIAYQLMGEPILYTHAQVTGQILTYSTKLLQAPKGAKNTEKTMAIRQTLLEEISRAKAGKRSKFVRYDTLYEESGQIPNGRTERNRQNNYVRGFLDRLITAGEIQAWEERKEGRKIAGFELTFSPREKSATAKASKAKPRKQQPDKVHKTR